MTRNRTLPPSWVRRSRGVHLEEGSRSRRGMRSPARKARPAIPPSPLMTCVARLPSTGGTPIPPSTAIYARAPCTAIAKSQHAARRARHDAAHRQLRSLEHWLQVAARDRNCCVLLEPQLRADNRGFERRRIGQIAEQRIRKAMRRRIHRTRHRHAEMLIAPPTGVLNRSEQPRSQNCDEPRGRLVRNRIVRRVRLQPDLAPYVVSGFSRTSAPYVVSGFSRTSGFT